MASKNIKYLEINLSKDVQDCYTENDKTLLWEINREVYYVHGSGDSIFLRWPLIYRLMQSLSKPQHTFLGKLTSWFYTLYGNAKDLEWTKQFWKRRTKFLRLLNFKTHYKVIVMNTVWYCYEDRQICQWIWVESSEIDPHINDKSVFEQDTKSIK